MISPNQVTIIRPDGTRDVMTVNDEPSMTQQQFKDECDINNIVKRYNDTGEFRHLTSKVGRYGDFSMITDYQEMLHTVQYAQEAFASLPAEVRANNRNLIWTNHGKFASVPALNSTFIVQNTPITRALASASAPQILFDAFFQYKHARPMMTYSVPVTLGRF